MHKDEEKGGQESWSQKRFSVHPILKMRGSLGAVASVRSCAPVEIQEFFGGSLGAKERMFRIGGLKMLPNGRNKHFFELAMNA